MRTLNRALLIVATGMFIPGPVTASANNYATIASIDGKVETALSGKPSWNPAKVNQPLASGQAVRTAGNSKAMVKYADNSIVTMGGDTRIAFPEPVLNGKTKKPNYLTVLYGHARYKTNESQPNFFMDKIFTPLAVVSIKGTDLWVAVDSATGRTDVAVLEGKVLVRNSILSDEFFVKSGSYTIVTLNTPPLKPAVMDSAWLLKLGQWGETVNPSMLNSKKEPAMQPGSRKMVIVHFLNNSFCTVDKDIGEIMSKSLVQALKNSVKGEVVYYPDNTKDAEDIGREEKAGLVISGEITSMNINRLGTYTNADGTLVDQYRGVVEMTLYIIDPVAGMLKKTIRVLESVAGDDKSSNDWKILDHYDFSDSTDTDKSESSTIGKALDESIEKSVEEISNFLAY